MVTRAFSATALAFIVSLVMATEVLAQGDTRSTREEIERLIDQADNQAAGSVSSPSDEPFSEAAQSFKPAPLEVAKDWLWNWGGWARGTVTSFDTPFDVDTTLRDYDVRLWGRVSYKNNHSLYSRIRTFVTEYNTSNGPGGDDYNWQKVRVDQMYYTGRWARAFGMDQTVDLDVSIGRQFFFMGNGAALSNVLDGARVFYRNKRTSFELIAAQTLHNVPDLDPSVNIVNGENESDRQFFGLSASTTAFLQRRFYFYFLTQVDRNHLNVPDQEYDYNSTYIGLGGQGAIPLAGLSSNDLSYSAELIFEFGKGGASDSLESETISAQAFMLDIYWVSGPKLADWLSEDATSRVVLSYYFGSGDADRGAPNPNGPPPLGSQLGTQPGNIARTSDNAFNYFGFVNTGLVLAPRLTNLNMLRLNYEITGMENAYRWMSGIKAGLSFYYFWKHHSKATITDAASYEASRSVGSEFNTYIDWSVSSDLDIGTRFGIFFPDAAYEVHEARLYASAFLSLSF